MVRDIKFLVLPFLFFQIANCKPFLTSSLPLASLVASASSPSSEPQTNIADLRRKKANLLQEKNFSADLFEEETLAPPTDQEDNNEAAPSFLQKKINKIVTKLRYISKLTGGPLSGNESDQKDQAFQKEFDEFEKEFAEDQALEGSGFEGVNLQNVSQEVVAGYVYNSPKRVGGNLEQQSGKLFFGNNEEDEGGSNFGVFLLELLSSAFSLIYGAGVHIASGATGSSNN